MLSFAGGVVLGADSVCRMHGGDSPGAPKGKPVGNHKNGRFTCEAVAEGRQFSAWIRAMAQFAHRRQAAPRASQTMMRYANGEKIEPEW
jgi:hypothetical protein